MDDRYALAAAGLLAADHPQAAAHLLRAVPRLRRAGRRAAVSACSAEPGERRRRVGDQPVPRRRRGGRRGRRDAGCDRDGARHRLAGGRCVRHGLAKWASAAVAVDGHVAMPGVGASRRGPPGCPPGLDGVRRRRRDDRRPRHRGDQGSGGLAEAQRRRDRCPGARWSHRRWRRRRLPVGSASGYYLPYVRDTVFGWDPETAEVLRGPDGEWVTSATQGLMPELAAPWALGARGRKHAVRRRAGRGDRARHVGARRTGHPRRLADVSAPGATGTRLADRLVAPAHQPAALDQRSGLAAMLPCSATGPRPMAARDDVARLVRVQGRPSTTGGPTWMWRTTGRRRRTRCSPGRGGPDGAFSTSTSQSSKLGAACAVTASSGYGSGATAPGTGLWLNNSLGELELNGGDPEPAGARLASNMALAGRSERRSARSGQPGSRPNHHRLAQVLGVAFGTAEPPSRRRSSGRGRTHHTQMTSRSRSGSRRRTAATARDRPAGPTPPLVGMHGGVASRTSSSGEITAAGDPGATPWSQRASSKAASPAPAHGGRRGDDGYVRQVGRLTCEFGIMRDGLCSVHGDDARVVGAARDAARSCAVSLAFWTAEPLDRAVRPDSLDARSLEYKPGWVRTLDVVRPGTLSIQVGLVNATAFQRVRMAVVTTQVSE